MPKMPTPEKTPWCVYILKCNNGCLYTGITNRLETRLAAHAQGTGSKFVRSHMPFSLAKTIPCQCEKDARRLEYRIKKLGRAGKIKFLDL
jgi:putative endonuclease